MRLFRVFARKHRATALSGEGARRFGGRWNSPGLAVVYASSSFSLALLEMMANARRGHVPPGMLYCTIDIPDDAAIDTLPARALPPKWYRSPPSPQLAAIGDAWLTRGEAVALLVPSAIARIENNALLNPHHRDFARLVAGAPHDVPADDRLRERR